MDFKGIIDVLKKIPVKELKEEFKKLPGQAKSDLATFLKSIINEGSNMKSDTSYGTAKFCKDSPIDTKVSRVRTITFDYENTLKLKVALDRAVQCLHAYDRSHTEGKNVGLAIVIGDTGFDLYEGKT